MNVKDVLTGDESQDINMLLQLDDRNLLTFCSWEVPKNAYQQSLCADEKFWEKRMKQIFGEEIGKNPDKTWSKFYKKYRIHEFLLDMEWSYTDRRLRTIQS